MYLAVQLRIIHIQGLIESHSHLGVCPTGRHYPYSPLFIHIRYTIYSIQAKVYAPYGAFLGGVLNCALAMAHDGPYRGAQCLVLLVLR